MKGSHRIIAETARIKYDFTIRRNLTILQGNSATGKTTLVDLLHDSTRGEIASSIRLTSDVPCIVYSAQETDWRTLIPSYEGSIVFIDEGYRFIRTKEFADLIRTTDNYYVLVTRESIPTLPYSINEIYGIRTSGRYHFPKQVYHEFYPIYEDVVICVDQQTVGSYVVTEDSGAGYLFLRACNSQPELCVSTNGNTGVYRMLRDLPKDRPVAVIADGAAFGALIEKVLTIAEYRKDTMLYLPESFEWIILKSGILNAPELKDVLERPEDFIDSRIHFSWDQFFTSYLRDLTSGDAVRRYAKDHLPAFYTQGQNKERILAVIPEEMQRAVTGG